MFQKLEAICKLDSVLEEEKDDREVEETEASDPQ
jgi:hypothetical protein